jgi:hypothetical protein
LVNIESFRISLNKSQNAQCLFSQRLASFGIGSNELYLPANWHLFNVK